MLHLIPEDEEHAGTWRCSCDPIVIPVICDGGRIKPAYWHLGEPWDGRLLTVDHTGQPIDIPAIPSMS